MASICYNNILRSATVQSEDTLSGFGIANALDGRTSSQVGFSSGANREVDFDLGATTAMKTLAIARHNLGTVGGTVNVYGSNDGSIYIFILALTPTDDKVNVKEWTVTNNYRYYRITISGHTSAAYIGDIFIGPHLELQRDQKHGFVKPDFSDGDTVIPNITRGQNLVGLNIKEQPKRVRFQMPFYSSSFFNDWESLVAQMKLYPVYIKWNDNETPFYCWPTRSMPQPSYSRNINGYYDIKMDMSGITQ